MLLRLLKSFMQDAWLVWERGFNCISSLRGSHTSHFGICKVMIKKHKGESIVCADSTIIAEGDLVGEIHLNNKMILTMIKSQGSDRTALMTARLVRKSMQQISDAFTNQPEFSEVRALVGITLLHRGLTHGLGFEQQHMKSSLFQRITTTYLRLLLSVLHPEGKKRIGRKTEQLIPMMLIHSRSSLTNRFKSVKRVTVPDKLYEFQASSNSL